MPSPHTFGIKPIKELLDRYINVKDVVVDPFAGNSQVGTITNDLNPNTSAGHHMDALTFLKTLKDGIADVVLFDPPYSITQATQCYGAYGHDKLVTSVSNMRYWAECKNHMARVLAYRGWVICFGWSSMGLGKNRGFEMVEILLVPHGGSKNDTIVTTERPYLL